MRFSIVDCSVTILCKYHTGVVAEHRERANDAFCAYSYYVIHCHTSRKRCVDPRHDTIWYAAANSKASYFSYIADTGCVSGFVWRACPNCPVYRSFRRISVQGIWMAAPYAPLLCGNIICIRSEMGHHILCICWPENKWENTIHIDHLSNISKGVFVITEIFAKLPFSRRFYNVSCMMAF